MSFPSLGALRGASILAAVVGVAAAAPVALADIPPVPLIDKAPSALRATTGNGSGGNGGNSSSASSATNTFSPAAFVNYNSIGGEPTTVVDRYPITSGTSPSNPAQVCSPASPCYADIPYVSNPLGLGFPGFSQFYRSLDGGTSFRLPTHNPFFGEEAPTTELSGGGDSHQAVGELSHRVFFVDLSGDCVTMNMSTDFGQSFSSNKLGCATNPGAIDDRQWVATDETAPGGTGNVYINFNNDSGCFATSSPGCYIALVKSTDDGGSNLPSDYSEAAQCNPFTAPAEAQAPDSTATECPDPTDPDFYIAGPIVVDKSASSPHHHWLYIPFERQVGQSDGTTDIILYIAKSTDEGSSWTRTPVANLGPHDAANIFPEMTVDQAGNLYYTWSQTQTLNSGSPQSEGETDVYYAYSRNAGTTWSAPIDLTKEKGDSAVFPWMVAGSPGKVDLVYYKANTGLNPNIAYYHPNGSDCGTSATPGCSPNTTQWNTYFAQSQNALNPGANFKSVQISPHPIHQGGVCTAGTACQSTAQQNRDLLDFFTVDVGHTGAAYVTWADDNDSSHDTRQFLSRQLAGASIFAGQNIAAKNSWPTTGHSATDPAGDTTDATGARIPCPSMDVLGDSAQRSGDRLTVTMTLGAPPSSAAAIGCAGLPGTATGGLWGAEFWAAAPVGPVPASPDGDANQFGNGEFYIAYRDNPADGGPGVEAGLVDSISPSFTHLEFHRQEPGAPATPGGTCFATPAPTGPCTVVMTASLSGLGIKSGSVLDSVTGLSVYYAGQEGQPPALRIPLGNSNLADAAAPFDINGTGTTATAH